MLIFGSYLCPYAWVPTPPNEKYLKFGHLKSRAILLVLILYIWMRKLSILNLPESKLRVMKPTLYAPTAVKEKKPSSHSPLVTTLSFRARRLGISLPTDGLIGKRVPGKCFASSI